MLALTLRVRTVPGDAYLPPRLLLQVRLPTSHRFPATIHAVPRHWQSCYTVVGFDCWSAPLVCLTRHPRLSVTPPLSSIPGMYCSFSSAKHPTPTLFHHLYQSSWTLAPVNCIYRERRSEMSITCFQPTKEAYEALLVTLSEVESLLTLIITFPHLRTRLWFRISRRAFSCPCRVSAVESRIIDGPV